MVQSLDEEGFTVGAYTGSGEDPREILGEGTYYYIYRLVPRSWFSAHFCSGCFRQSVLAFLWHLPVLGRLVFRNVGFKPRYTVVKKAEDSTT